MQILNLTQQRLVLKSTSDTTYYQRVDPPRLSGECSPEEEWFCPNSREDTIEEDHCSWKFPCNTGGYALRCDNSMEDEVQCECWENRVKKKTFHHPVACKDLTLARSIDVANAGCGWKVSLSIP